MVRTPVRCLLGVACLILPILVQANPSSPSESPSSETDLICPTDNPTECYPRVFQPTKDFQVIREGQDIPGGLHVRMNVYEGVREARLNIPMEREEETIPEGVSMEQAVAVVEHPEAEPEPEPEKPALRDQVPIKPPGYESAGKIPPPIPDAENGDDMGTFQKALLTIKMEARAFDSALGDLSDLAHDIYYGVEIAKDGPVVEKLICLTVGSGSERMPSDTNERDRKAASILGAAIQNNPTALKEIAQFRSSVMYPTCGFEVLADKTQKQGNFVGMLRSRIGREKSPNALKAKLGAISGLLKEPGFRDEFLEKGGMELLLAIFLKNGEQFDPVRRKVGQLLMDNFLDEDLGAVVGIWPKGPVSGKKTCETKGKMLDDGCWEHHIEAFSNASPDEAWAKEVLVALTGQTKKFAEPKPHTEL
ncbi:Uncharacterized protein BP5553_02895 [Venustampulla echinocandica]|uniref:Nucleotide exchange factor SIL1 n=1 Tax=Venustampulla echinocandica TaxID=2656787 RepID=A0A370TSP1_9HELO|nr:Uncharacterized protein BP5553_02895 [Venustampulla echinocandica]RDL38555.1 Uncharacterized protein BP5553_02895 [Venustampulla echinocandica]